MFTYVVLALAKNTCFCRPIFAGAGFYVATLIANSRR
jgi:hypothetical protein